MDWRRNLLWLAVPLIVVGFLLVIVLNPDYGEHVIVGYLIGTVFGHATVASAWTASGPLPLILRLPLALQWLAVSVACIALNVWVHNGPAEILMALGACVLGQYRLALTIAMIPARTAGGSSFQAAITMDRSLAARAALAELPLLVQTGVQLILLPSVTPG